MLLSRVAYFTLGTLLLAGLAGCGDTPEATGSSSGSGASSGSGSGSGGGTSTTTSSSSGDFDAGGTVNTIEKDMGPIKAQAGMENTQCVTVNLNNAEGGFVRRFRAELGSGSHHMVVYTSTATTESPVPVDCQPLNGIFKGEHPIFIAQQAKADLVFPTDEAGKPVGFEIQPHQMVKLEMHYIDTTPMPIDVTGKIFLDTIPLSADVTKSDIAFLGTKNFGPIAPHSTGTTNVRFQQALPGTHSFALTTHQHQYGTEMQVWYAKDVKDTTNRVADGKNWSDPPLELLTPSLAFPGSNGEQGFAYQCDWNNTSNQDVTFGEFFNNEMCFLWHYYYPSQGFQMCLDGGCKTSP